METVVPPEYVAEFCRGLELAGELVERLDVRSPVILRNAAEAAEARATSPLEMGCAIGYRIIAAELEDRRPRRDHTDG